MKPMHVIALAIHFWFVCSYDYKAGCVDGIRTDLADFVFEGSAATDYWGDLCTNPLCVTSIWAAAKVYCSPEEIAAGEAYLGGYCEEYGFVKLIPYAEVSPNLTQDFITSLPIVEFSDIDATKIWNHSVMLSKSFYEVGYNTVVLFEKVFDTHVKYGWAVYGFWGTVLLVGIINRLVTLLSQPKQLRGTVDTEAKTSATTSIAKRTGIAGLIDTIRHFFHANLIIPAAFGSHRQRPLYYCTIPTRLETIVIFAFWVLMFILCFVSYETYWPNLYYTVPGQLARYISDRTGTLSYAALPFLWMFSGRNNIFLWLTGWSFSTFNIFHRHIARQATLFAIVHSIGYTVLELMEGKASLYTSWKEEYWWMGAAATITMSLIVATSFFWFRKNTYELFLLLHIVFSVLIIVALFYHTAIFDGEFDGYLWPLVAIWLFDRFARIAKLVWCNIYLKFSGNLVTTRASATYDEASNLIKLEIIPGSRMLQPRPGQHYYLYQRVMWPVWENHPFTLASWENSTDSKNTNGDTPSRRSHEPCIEVKREDQIHTEASSVESTGSEECQIITRSDPEQHRLTFLVRPYNSYTKRLRNQCLKSPSRTIQPPVSLEGPYGEHSPLHTYENIVYVVGGSGITAAMPYLLDHVARTSVQQRDIAGTMATRTQQITFVWATKQSAMIDNLAAAELRPIIGREDTRLIFHATSPKELPKASQKDDIDDSPKNLPTKSSKYEIVYGRPDVSDIILHVIDDIHQAGPKGGRVAVFTCGPAAMADEARAAVHTALKQGKRSVEYFEETFGW